MSGDHVAIVISPSTFQAGGDSGPYPVGMFERLCLAQGDSWFSIGSLPPGRTTNILQAPLVLQRSTLVANCSRPGKLLKLMTDTTTDPEFLNLLSGRLSWKWHAILISGGGNDLIVAAHVGPDAPLPQRLFLTETERPPSPGGPGDYLSAQGWTTFAVHLTAVFNQLVDTRDGGQNKLTPLVLHDYAYVMPRNAPAGPHLGPWLYPSMMAYKVPKESWGDVAKALLDKLSALLRQLIAARKAASPTSPLYLVDSLGAGLAIADRDAPGPSGDFLNEIHPTRLGYQKLAAAWRTTLDPILG